jgi:hypothetical protein
MSVANSKLLPAKGVLFFKESSLTRTFEKCEIQEVEYGTIFLK